MRGRFITFEGIEGTGKSTQLARLANYLREQGIDCITTREPGGTALAEKIRSLLLSDTAEPMCHETELLLMFAARVQHISAKIEPALASGSWVLCDRFIDATYAYQGYGRGIPVQRIDQLCEWALQQFTIDLTLLLDMPVAAASQRVSARGARDRFEQEASGFFEKVRQGYLQMANRHAHRMRVIQAEQSPEQVTEMIIAQLASLLNGTSRI